MEFEFENPVGKCVKIKSLHDFIDIISKLEESDWRAGSGDASLQESGKDGNYLAMIKMGNEQQFMLLSGKDSGRFQYVYLPVQKSSKFVTVTVGGQPSGFPVEFFTSYDNLMKFANELLTNGKINYTSDWPLFSEVGWLLPDEGDW